jgi:hypothetical protein
MTTFSSLSKRNFILKSGFELETETELEIETLRHFDLVEKSHMSKQVRVSNLPELDNVISP